MMYEPKCGICGFGLGHANTCPNRAALTREQEAQPADDGLREDIQPINTGPKKPAVVGRRAAQPAAQEPGDEMQFIANVRAMYNQYMQWPDGDWLDEFCKEVWRAAQPPKP